MSNMDRYTNQITQDIPEDELLSVQEAKNGSGWRGFHKGRRYEVSAKSAMDAKEQVVKLAKKNNKGVVITTSDITVKPMNEELISEAQTVNVSRLEPWEIGAIAQVVNVFGTSKKSINADNVQKIPQDEVVDLLRDFIAGKLSKKLKDTTGKKMFFSILRRIEF